MWNATVFKHKSFVQGKLNQALTKLSHAYLNSSHIVHCYHSASLRTRNFSVALSKEIHSTEHYKNHFEVGCFGVSCEIILMTFFISNNINNALS